MYIKKIKKTYQNTGKSYFAFVLFETIETAQGPKESIIMTLGTKLNLPEAKHQILADAIEAFFKNKPVSMDCPLDIKTLAQDFANQLDKRQKVRNKFKNKPKNDLKKFDRSSRGSKSSRYGGEEEKPRKSLNLRKAKVGPRDLKFNKDEPASTLEKKPRKGSFDRKPRFGAYKKSDQEGEGPKKDYKSFSIKPEAERKPRFGTYKKSDQEGEGPKKDYKSFSKKPEADRKPRFGAYKKSDQEGERPKKDYKSFSKKPDADRKPRFGADKKSDQEGERPKKDYKSFSKKPGASKPAQKKTFGNFISKLLKKPKK